MLIGERIAKEAAVLNQGVDTGRVQLRVEEEKKDQYRFLFSVLPELCSNRLRTLGHFGGRLSTGFPLPKVE
jgi:hypothetical protein